MPLPYQYRDTPLALFMAVVYFIAAVVWMLDGGDQLVQITLAEECCAAETCPVKDSLASLPFVSNVIHDERARGRVISMRARRGVTPEEVWDAVEATGKRPSRIVINDREISGKPSK